ncbi:O-antigen translocase [Grimontia hollisae]|uniref:O-antigen translocase n=1 Tax=Grimontia hollisae TaxID=673 RepID=A0A377HMD5_GRIHO|nr:O-antigen translocase [Grimontia hollisae]STO56905.1 O-antigen translocase [Grimontia hollisae]
MRLLKTASLSILSTVFKITTALVVNKMMSIMIGPTGLALIGQFQNFIQITNTIGTVGFGSGIVSLTSKHRKNCAELEILWSTTLTCVLFVTSVTSIIIILFNNEFSYLVFGDSSYRFVFIILSVVIFFNNINLIFLSIINGLKKIKRYVLLLILQSIYSFITSIVLIFYFKIDGALTSLAISQLFIFTLSTKTFIRIVKRSNISIKLGVNKNFLKKILSFSGMALTSAIMGPLSLFFVRNYLGENLNWSYAGYWQSIWYISSMYLMLVTGVLSTYFLPKLSETDNKNSIKEEIIKILIFIIPASSFSLLIIYFFREYLVTALFSKDFLIMLPLFKWQLIGDCLKVISYVFSYFLIAKSKTIIFIFLEFFYFLTFSILTIYLVDLNGLIGTTYAYAFSNLLYMLVMIVVTKKLLITRSFN